MLVLVVDDAPDLRTMVATALRMSGIDSAQAEGGPQALALLQGGLAPDAILLDVQMPEMDGWETLETIRREPWSAGYAVIMCSVKARDHDLEHGWRLGCDGYIPKPFDIASMVGDVRRVAAMSGEERTAARAAALATLEARRRVSSGAWQRRS